MRLLFLAAMQTIDGMYRGYACGTSAWSEDTLPPVTIPHKALRKQD